MPTKTSVRRDRRQLDLIGLQEAADYLGVSYRTVRRWVSNGTLTAYRAGPRLLKVDTAELASVLHPVGGAV